jgi:(5-formylfuran-3-yl)methyl phosphate synthase
MAGLLVSVRSVEEAAAALAGGAALIDVKEPAYGSLGRASGETISQVVAFVAKRVPVSAALGELLESRPILPPPGLSYAKWGLAGCGRRPDWQGQLLSARADISSSCSPVAVAYADWRRADAPPVQEIVSVARRHHFPALLLDTWCKDGSTLLDWLSISQIFDVCAACRSAGVQVALAGALGLREIETLRHLQPTWFAVRSAVCRSRDRLQPVDPDAVRELAELISASSALKGHASSPRHADSSTRTTQLPDLAR